ncbi:hypothetical protein JB92DRAFT_2828449 [Gautieria morchelliformis]|nr:hypothetical protein JB92DRAFT_2828449 [Gautieria morchelliformis]
MDGVSLCGCVPLLCPGPPRASLSLGWLALLPAGADHARAYRSAGPPARFLGAAVVLLGAGGGPVAAAAGVSAAVAAAAAVGVVVAAVAAAAVVVAAAADAGVLRLLFGL